MLQRAGRDRVHDLLLRHVRFREHVHRLAEPQHGDPVGDLEDVVQVVRDEHDADAAVGEAADEVEHLARLCHAQGGRRLVEDDHLRLPHDRFRDRDRLPLTARQPGHLLADGAQRRHVERVERLAAPSAPCRARRGRRRGGALARGTCCRRRRGCRRARGPGTRPRCRARPRREARGSSRAGPRSAPRPRPRRGCRRCP